jgi:hypothetical protein
MRNAATTYASSVSTDVAAYEDLPGHHLLAVRNLVATTNDESYHGSASEVPPATLHEYAEWDFSSVPVPVMFQRFLDAADYWFGCSDDSGIGIYDPARECFVVVTDEQADGANGVGAGDGDAPQNPRPSAPPTSLTGGIGITALLAQARELEAKLAEEYRQVWLLRATIMGEASARDERARELGKQARECIDADFKVDDPHTPPRASQKHITAATLLRAMPEPSIPEARNLHREAQALIEQAAVQQVESSASRIRHQPSAWDDGGAQGQEASVHVGGATRQQANQGRTPAREWILDARGQTMDRDARNVINARRRATQRRERRWATTHDGVVATTTEMIAHRRQNPRERACSTGRSARRASPSASDSPPRSTNTRGRQTLMCGSTTTTWPASWAAPPPMR